MKPNWRSSPCARKWRQKPPRSLTGRKPPPVTRSPAWNSIVLLLRKDMPAHEEKHSWYVDSLFRSMTEV